MGQGEAGFLFVLLWALGVSLRAGYVKYNYAQRTARSLQDIWRGFGGFYARTGFLGLKAS
jgi:hypothetical protein